MQKYFQQSGFYMGHLCPSSDLLTCEAPRGGTSAGIERCVLLVFALCLQAQGRLLASHLVCSAFQVAMSIYQSCHVTLFLFLVFACVIDKLVLATYLQNHSFNSKFLGYKNKWAFNNRNIFSIGTNKYLFISEGSYFTSANVKAS